MTFRVHLATIFLFLVALSFGSSAAAIEDSLVIDPNGTVTDSTESEDRMGEIFSGEGSSAGMIVSIMVYVVILSVLVAAAWFLFKKGFFRKSFGKSDSNKLKVAETRMLGNRQFIMVVEYEDQKILLGVGPGKIDYLTNLNSFRGSEFPAVEQDLQAGGQAG